LDNQVGSSEVARITRSSSSDYSLLTVYRDDLEKIVSIMGELTADVRLTADDYTLTAVTDLTALSERKLGYFSVRGELFGPDVPDGEHGLVEVRLGRAGATVYVSNVNSLRMVGAGSEIERILRTCSSKHWSRHLASNWIYAPGFVGVALIVWDLSRDWSLSLRHPDLSGVVGLAVVVIGLLLMAIPIGLLELRNKYRMRIINEYLSAETTFWSRNRDAIIVQISVGVIVALIGALIGALITLWLVHP
jgi:hypothetical protein